MKTIVVLLFLFSLLLNCNSFNYKKYSKSILAMGTELSITVFSTNKQSIVNKDINACFTLANELENKVSCKKDNSIISELNKAKKLNITDDFVFGLIKKACWYADMTFGTFDPSLYHIIDVWGFETGENKVPEPSNIARALQSSGHKNISIDNRTVILSKNISLDLGGIAKGAILQEISTLLKNLGYQDYLINGGGDIVVSGMYDGKRPWHVAIANPFTKGDIIGSINASNCTIVTSGDYERFFIDNKGELYHHIIDPKTGYPAATGLHSVTVISHDPIAADALSTALFILGQDSGLKFVASLADTEAIFVSGTIDDIQIKCSKKDLFNK